MSGEDKTSDGGGGGGVGEGGIEPKRRKAAKYIIYLPWPRETNAFTVIEDTSPSHVNTHTHTHTHVLASRRQDGKKKKKTNAEKRLFLKQDGKRERGIEGKSLTRPK